MMDEPLSRKTRTPKTKRFDRGPWWTLVILLGWALNTPGLLEAQPEARNLQAWVEAAEAHYPALRADDSALRAAEAQLGEARYSPFFRWEVTAGATLAPSAHGTAIFSDQGQLPFDGWGPALGVNIRGAIPLYTFGKLQGLRSAAEAGVDAVRAQRGRTLARVQYDVRRAYFGLQFALDVEQMLSEGMGQLESATVRLAELIEDGDASVNPIDQRRLAAALAEVRARASEVVRVRESSEAALAALTGEHEIRVPDCPMGQVRLETQDVDALVARARQSRPEVRMLEAARAARRANVSIQRGGYGPDIAVAFQAGYTWTPGQTNQDNPWIADPANQPSLGAGLVLRWNLDFVGTAFRTQRAEAELEQTEAQIEEAQLGMTLEVQLAVSQLEDGRRREAAWREGERETRAWFVAAAQAYDIGASEPSELIDALKAYFSARASHLQALMEFNVAAAALQRASGQELVSSADWEAVCD